MKGWFLVVMKHLNVRSWWNKTVMNQAIIQIYCVWIGVLIQLSGVYQKMILCIKKKKINDKQVLRFFNDP